MKEGVWICWTSNVEWKLKELLIVFILLNPKPKKQPRCSLSGSSVSSLLLSNNNDSSFQLESGEEVEVEEFYVKFKGL